MPCINEEPLRLPSMFKGRLLTSKAPIRRFRLESASNVAKSLKALYTKGILRKEKECYVFEDVLLCRWVEKLAEQAAL
jgi:hypothetical protein